jgi:putative DNA primase/helicase
MSKVGIDDYLVSHSAEEFRGLLDSAADPDLLYASEIEPVAAVTNPHRLAHAYQKENSEKPIRYYNGCFFRYNGTNYDELSEADLRPQIVRSVKQQFHEYDKARLLHWEKQKNAYDDADDDDKPVKPGQRPTEIAVTRSLVGDVLQAFESEVHVGLDLKNTPAWLNLKEGEKEPFSAQEALIARNGIVNMKALLAGERDFLYPHTPDLFSTRKPVTFDVTLSRGEPREWLKFLHQLWTNDEQSIRTLQQWFGYLLTPATYLQKALMLLGPKRSGKGTITRVLTYLLGQDNTASTSFAVLASRFGLESGRQVTGDHLRCSTSTKPQ